MSKSLGNFYTLRDLLEKGCSPEAIRYILISTHYRSKLNFTFEEVRSAQKCINKLRELKRRLENVKEDGSNNSPHLQTEKMLAGFSEILGDDLNISGALGELFIWVNYLFIQLDGETLPCCSSREALRALEKIDSILGVMEFSDHDVDNNINELIQERNKARAEKDWTKADEVLNKLDDL